MVGHGARPASCCTPAASSITPTACRTCSARSTSCWRPGASAGRAAATRRSPARATARAAASTARSATSSRAGATSRTPSTAATSPTSGASTTDELPRAGRRCLRDRSARSTRGEIKGLLSICFNPVVSLPDSNFITRMLEKLEFFVAIDFFLSETARHADVVLPGSLHEEDEGTVTQVEGRVIKINKAVDCPARREQDWRIIQDIAAALGRPQRLHVRTAARDLRGAAASPARAASPTTPASPTRRSSSRWASSGRARHDPNGERCRSPGHAAAVRAGSWNPVAKGAGPFYFPDGKARFNVAEYAPPAEDVDAEYPVILTTGRVVSQFLSRHADAAHRPAGGPVSGAASRDAPAAGGEARHRRRRLGRRSRRAAATITLRAQVVTTIRPDTVFVPYHWAGQKSVNQLTIAAQDPISKIPEYKVCGCRVRKADGAAGVRRAAGAAAIAEGAMPEPTIASSSSTRTAASAARRACRRAASATRTGALDDPPRVRRPRQQSMQTVPVVCMHCDRRPAPRSARPTPSSAPPTASCRRPASRAASPATTASGLPVRRAEDDDEFELMMKCDMCYDRTSVGKKPMCATVCPSQALFYGTREEIERLRPQSAPINTFQFGEPDDHDQGERDGAARHGRRSRTPRRDRRRCDDRRAAAMCLPGRWRSEMA